MSPPLAHPDPDNRPSVGLCLLWREPHGLQPQPTPTPNLSFCSFESSASVHFSPTSLLISFFFPLPVAVMTLSFLLVSALCSVFLFPSHTFLRSFYFTITHSPVRSIYLRVAESFPPTQDSSVCDCYGVLSSLSSPLSFSGALHLHC